MRTGFVRHASHSGFLSGRAISSYMGTWVLSDHDSSAAPQTVQIASPVCGTKNFSSVRLYSAPQLHCTIVAIPGICASDRRFSSPELCHNRIDHYRRAGRRACGTRRCGFGLRAVMCRSIRATAWASPASRRRTSSQKVPPCCRHTLPEAFGFVPIST